MALDRLVAKLSIPFLVFKLAAMPVSAQTSGNASENHYSNRNKTSRKEVIDNTQVTGIGRKDGRYKITIIGDVIEGEDDPKIMQEYVLAELHFNKKRYGNAVMDFEKFIAKHSTHPLAEKARFRHIQCEAKTAPLHYLESSVEKLGALYPESQYLDSARQILQEGKREQAEPFFQKGQEKYEQGFYNGAKKEFEKAIEIDNANPEYWNKLGDCHQSLGDYDNAIRYFEKSIQIDPYKGYYNAIGSCYFRMNKIEESAKAWKKGIELVNSEKCRKNYEKKILKQE